jgi:hypothetical protein
VSGEFGRDREAVARSEPRDLDVLMQVVTARAELLEPGLCLLFRWLEPPGMPPIPGLGTDRSGRLVMLESCPGTDRDVVTVLDHLDWLAENQSLLRSLGTSPGLPDLASDWRVLIVLGAADPTLARRLRWVSDLSFEFWVVRALRVDGRSVVHVEPWSDWRYRRSRLGGESVEIETLGADSILTPEEKEAFLDR